jgi:hypothetical protein
MCNLVLIEKEANKGFSQLLDLIIGMSLVICLVQCLSFLWLDLFSDFSDLILLFLDMALIVPQLTLSFL